jgi:hypothetical protein
MRAGRLPRATCLVWGRSGSVGSSSPGLALLFEPRGLNPCDQECAAWSGPLRQGLGAGRRPDGEQWTDISQDELGPFQ